MCAQAYHVHTRVYILGYLISVPFVFFIDSRVRVRVSSRVRDSVSFIFFAFFFFQMYVKRLKITTRSTVPCWLSGTVFVLCLLGQESRFESRAVL